jgi:tRNA pseudouridine32 synthase/23S rRNA pseudouridine746 synthase
MRDGVSASRVALVPGPWRTVIEFLAQRLPAVDAAGWRARLLRGEVLDASGRPLGPDEPCTGQTTLWYWRQLERPEPRVPFEAELLFRDDHLVVVDKPHFLSMTPKGRHLQETLLVRLKRQLGLETLVPMHRLDRETAGVVLFTVQPASRAAYQNLLRDRQVHKVYEAVALWRSDLSLPLVRRSRLEESPAFMQMHEVVGEPNAETRIDLLQQAGARALYRLTPLTGQKHQLRAHMNALGLPIVGDRIYPTLWPEPAPDASPDYSEPLRLLARRIAFTDPLSGAPRCFESRRQLALD